MGAPKYHLADQHGCSENDPNGPVFDPVHGVIHHFYQKHLAAPPGQGPAYGHFVSKDFVHWAAMPVAIWNGLDSSVWPPKKTAYDIQAIYSGSAVVVDGAGPDGRSPGVVNIYPGLCTAIDWHACKTGTLLAQAVPANYASDQLLTNWTKASYNPILENTQRDPSTPWKTPAGEWRMRTFDSMVYGAASDLDLLKGHWYEIGVSKDFETCECPSFYELPGSTPGFEAAYLAADQGGTLPTHVHKVSCSSPSGKGLDYWQAGTYKAGPPKTLGSFLPTKGWEDVFVKRIIDAGSFYASKDNEYPTKSGGKRRINWGWLTVPVGGTQSLPRAITFNAVTRSLEQTPIEELEALRRPAAYSKGPFTLVPNTHMDLGLAKGVAKQSEFIGSFFLPNASGIFGWSIGGPHRPLDCTIDYAPPSSMEPFYEVPVACGCSQGADGKYGSPWHVRDTLRLVRSEKTVEVRVFLDNTFVEVFFQGGRVAMTVSMAFTAVNEDTKLALMSTTGLIVQSAVVYPMLSIWVTPDVVRQAHRVYTSDKRQLRTMDSKSELQV